MCVKSISHHGTFADRRSAGQKLAKALSHYRGVPGVFVLALPRGGVPVAFEVALGLAVPMDVFIVRKLGAPWNEEFALGAIASGGTRVVDQDLVDQLGMSTADVDHLVAREQRELERRERLYRGDRLYPNLEGLILIVVDDGMATGASMAAAVRALRRHSPSRVVVAVPVSSREACALLGRVADECVCVSSPEPFEGVGQWYRDFSQTTDAEVIALVQEAGRVG